MRRLLIPVTLEETAQIIRESDPFEGSLFSIPGGELIVDLDGPVTEPMRTLARLRGVPLINPSNPQRERP